MMNTLFSSVCFMLALVICAVNVSAWNMQIYYPFAAVAFIGLGINTLMMSRRRA